LDLNGSDTSSQGSIEPGEPEENDYGEREVYEYKRGETRTKSQQGGAEQRFVNGDTEQDDEEHEVKEEGRKNDSGDKDHPEANLEVAFSHPRLRHHDIDSI
jgi:hypothetical protein